MRCLFPTVPRLFGQRERAHYLRLDREMEDDLEPVDAMDYGEEDASFGSTEEEEEEVIDYEGMKSALEMFQKVGEAREERVSRCCRRTS